MSGCKRQVCLSARGIAVGGRGRWAHFQDDNPIKRVWHPEPNHKGNSEPGLQLEDKTQGIISHHEVLARLEAYDTDRG